MPEYSESHAAQYKSERDASGKTGYYSGKELAGLNAAQCLDEIGELQARIKQIRKDRRRYLKEANA